MESSSVSEFSDFRPFDFLAEFDGFLFPAIFVACITKATYVTNTRKKERLFNWRGKFVNKDAGGKSKFQVQGEISYCFYFVRYVDVE